MTEELKPCPFCHGVCIARAGHHMTCVRCGAEGPDADNPTDDEAITAWNTRAAPPASTGVVPEGWKLVPVEPTEPMCKAAVVFANGNAVYKNVAAGALKIEEGIYGEAYSAMLSAAPTYGGDQGKEES